MKIYKSVSYTYVTSICILTDLEFSKNVLFQLPSNELPNVEEWNEENANNDARKFADRKYSAESTLLAVNEFNNGNMELFLSHFILLFFNLLSLFPHKIKFFHYKNLNSFNPHLQLSP